MQRSRQWLFTLILVLAVGGLIEYTCLRVGYFLTDKGVFYAPQDVSRFRDYMARRHPVLGWLQPEKVADEVDASGSRLVPAFPEPGGECGSLYGDSMTWGAEVDSEHSWANVLSRLLGCRVANYGVSAYGTDQALLRFELERGDRAPLVVLGHLSENILRNVNQYRRLLYPINEYGLKPRFVVGEDGELELIPLPTVSEAEFARLTREPELFLPYEYFRLRDPKRVRILRFPYTLSILDAFGDFRVRAELARRPGHAEFYDPEHPSGALAVTAGILERFEAGARRQGRLPLPLVIPTGSDFEYFLRTGAWSFQPLIDRLAARGVAAFNPGPAMVAALAEGRHPCELVFRRCSGHFNEEGYALLARALYEELGRRGWLERLRAATPARSAAARGAPP